MNVIFIKSTFDIFDHETCFSDCRVSDHAYFDDDTTPKRKEVSIIFDNVEYIGDRSGEEAPWNGINVMGIYLFFLVGLA